MSGRLTLSEVLRRVELDWHEAIAVVREVTEDMLGSPSRARVVPELDQIQIASTGEIDVVGGASSGEPLRRLGQLLQATLGRSDPPVQLRLIVSQTTASTPSFDSIREFDAALGYYERPDRRAVLRALYARADAAPPDADSEFTPTLDSAAPRYDADRPTEAQKVVAKVSTRRSMRLVACALSIFILIGFAVQSGRVKGVTPGAGQISAMTRRASDAVGVFVLSGLSAVTERVGLGRLVWSETGEAASAPAASAPRPTRSAVAPQAPAPSIARPPSGGSNAQSAPTQPIAPAQPLLAFDHAPVAAALTSSAVRLDGAAPSPAQPSEPLLEKQDSDAALTMVYSTESAEVVPPVGTRPQLPRDLPSNIRREDLVSIELVVSTDGTVDSVKLLGEIYNVHDLMWLSAVKAWQFRPALKDGYPVKYRKIVWIAPQP